MRSSDRQIAPAAGPAVARAEGERGRRSVDPDLGTRRPAGQVADQPRMLPCLRAKMELGVLLDLVVERANAFIREQRTVELIECAKAKEAEGIVSRIQALGERLTNILK